MLSWFAPLSEAALLLPIAIAASWIARPALRTFTRRAVRRAQRSDSSWRVRLDRLGDDGQADVRKRQRADAVARMIGQFVTVVIFTRGDLRRRSSCWGWTSCSPSPAPGSSVSRSH